MNSNRPFKHGDWIFEKDDGYNYIFHSYTDDSDYHDCLVYKSLTMFYLVNDTDEPEQMTSRRHSNLYWFKDGRHLLTEKTR